MQISLTQFFIRELHFEQEMQPSDGESKFEFDFVASFYSERKQDFFIEFNLFIDSPKEFSCKLQYVFLFTTTEEITDNFMRSPFPIVNAPAIAFPFIRTFISNLTINSGYAPLILPSINFTRLEENKKVMLDGRIIDKPMAELGPAQ